MVRIDELENGVIVASERMASVESAAIGVWIEVGSRDEETSDNGLSHLYEHMVFKGTRRRSPLEIARELEDRGGYLNAFTTKEHTCFHARVVRDDLPRALDILCDLTMEPLLSADDLAKENLVVCEEIRGYEDTPDDHVHDLFAAAHYRSGGLELPVTGTVRSVRGIGRARLLAHQRAILKQHRVLVTAAGRLDHDWLVSEIRERLAHKVSTGTAQRRAIEWKPGRKVLRRDVSQCNVVLGGSMPNRGIRERLALSILNVLFGDGMSSRLFQSVREAEGLAYSVSSGVDSWAGCRTMSIALGCEPRKTARALDLVLRDCDDLVRNGPRADEVERARTNLLGTLRLGLDSANARMNRLARQLMRGGHYHTMQETVQTLQSISLEEVVSVSRELLGGAFALSAVVPKGWTQPDWRSWQSGLG